MPGETHGCSVVTPVYGHIGAGHMCMYTLVMDMIVWDTATSARG